MNRPELRNAVAHAKRSKAVLVVAKLDRFLRSTVVRAMLKTTGVRFVACDNPHANELTIAFATSPSIFEYILGSSCRRLRLLP